MRRSTFLAMALVCFAALFGAENAAAKLDAQTGVLATPRNFPNHTAADIEDMFRLSAELGSFSVIRVDWNDAKRLEVARVLVTSASTSLQ